jgi:hypothetical protein
LPAAISTSELSRLKQHKENVNMGKFLDGGIGRPN